MEVHELSRRAKKHTSKIIFVPFGTLEFFDQVVEIFLVKI